mmetsp:Transcript_2609/g.5661  ORF Transcript_2609/g.5661 Transcript_2609/m.5661 type:complete len:394 (+) Transcript_2609:95-1276(+)
MKMRTRTRIFDWIAVVLSVAFVFVLVGASSKNNRPHITSPSRSISNIEITPIEQPQTKPEENKGNGTVAAVKEKKETKPKKKRPNTKTSDNNNGARSYSSVGTTTTSTSLRRIKKEYKDAVDMGIAYDWVNQRLITRKTKTKKASSVDSRSPTIMCLGPITTNLRQWHFSFRGAGEGVYSQGIYHGQIILPKDYPLSPPSVQMWTPSGRFIPGKDICLSASNYHPESWTPRWSIQGIVNALRLHMLSPPNEIGGMQSTHDKGTELARLSLVWKQTWRDGRNIITVDHRQLIQEGILTESDLEERIDDHEIEDDCRKESDEEEESEYDLESELYRGVAVEDDDVTTTEDGIFECNGANDVRIRFSSRFSLSMATVTSVVRLICLYMVVLLFLNR